MINKECLIKEDYSVTFMLEIIRFKFNYVEISCTDTYITYLCQILCLDFTRITLSTKDISNC